MFIESCYILDAGNSNLRNSLPSGSSQSSGKDRKINSDTPYGKCHKGNMSNVLTGPRKPLTTSGCVGCCDRDQRLEQIRKKAVKKYSWSCISLQG